MRERTRTCGAGGAYAAAVPRVKCTLDAIVGSLFPEVHSFRRQALKRCLVRMIHIHVDLMLLSLAVYERISIENVTIWSTAEAPIALECHRLELLIAQVTQVDSRH